MPDLPVNLPEGTQEVFAKYLSASPAPREMLSNQIAAYLESVSHASGENEFLDLATARKLGRGLNHLLRDCSDVQLPYVQAATSYFINSDDANPDLESMLGFDDDAEVFNAVCHHLGRADLEVDI